MKTKAMIVSAGVGWAVGCGVALGQCYTGGVGACYAMDAMAASFQLGGPMVTLSSASDQTFARGYTPVAMSVLTIAAGTNEPGISNGTPMAVWIPAGFAMTWDATNVNAALGGSGAGKVNATVSYAGSNQRLVLAVTGNFTNGEQVTVNALGFRDILGSGSTQLELDYDNDGVADALDDKQVTIAGVFAGGDGDNYSLNQTLLEKYLHPVGTLISIARLGL